MRRLKISTNKIKSNLPDVPEQLKFVEQIAKQYAKSTEEVEQYYKVGLKAIETLNITLSDTKIVWIVRQTILQEHLKQSS